MRPLLASCLAVALMAAAPEPLRSAEEELIAISEEGHNIRAQVAYSPGSKAFLVVWVRANDVASYAKTRLYAALLRERTLTIRRELRISRASSRKRHAPFVGLAYHAALNRFLIAWQEISGSNRTLFLTTLDDSANFVLRSKTLVRGQGVLIAPPLLGVDSETGRVLAIWGESHGRIIKTFASHFDPENPLHRTDPRYLFHSGEEHIEVTRALARSGQSFRLFSFLADTAIGANVNINSWEIGIPTGPAAGSRGVTRVGISLSMALSATPIGEAQENILLAYNRTTPKLTRSTVSTLVVNGNGRATARPVRISPPGAFTRELVVLPEAWDGLARIVWVEEYENLHRLNLMSVDEGGNIVGEPTVVLSSALPIGNLAVAYGADGESALAVWSEDTEDGGICLLAHCIDLVDNPPEK